MGLNFLISLEINTYLIFLIGTLSILFIEKYHYLGTYFIYEKYIRRYYIYILYFKYIIVSPVSQFCIIVHFHTQRI